MADFTVIDGSDTDAQIRDLTGEPAPEPEVKPIQPRNVEEPEDGLTDDERKGLTDKMVRQIGKRTARMRAAEERAQSMEAELHASKERIREMERELARLSGGHGTEEELPKPPRPDQFKSQEEYDEALEKWSDARADRRIAERRQKEAEEISKALVAERLDRARKIVPDFDKTLTDAEQINVQPELGAYIQDSDKVAELAYYFAQHPEDLRTLSKMPTRSPRDLVRLGLALGRIEDKLQPFGANPKEKPSESGQDSSATEIVTPSRPRSSAAIVEPLRPRGSAEIVQSDESVSSAVRGFEKRNGASLLARKRH